MQGSGNGGKTLDIAPVITGQTKKRADFCGCFRGRNVPNSSQERGIWQKALLSYPMAQVTDLFGSESTFCGPQFEFSVPKSLEDLAEPSEVFLPCGGEHYYVIEIK